MNIDFTIHKRGYMIEWSAIERRMRKEMNDAIRTHAPKSELTFRVTLELVQNES